MGRPPGETGLDLFEADVDVAWALRCFAARSGNQHPALECAVILAGLALDQNIAAGNQSTQVLTRSTGESVPRVRRLNCLDPHRDANPAAGVGNRERVAAGDGGDLAHECIGEGTCGEGCEQPDGQFGHLLSGGVRPPDEGGHHALEGGVQRAARAAEVEADEASIVVIQAKIGTGRKSDTTVLEKTLWVADA